MILTSFLPFPFIFLSFDSLLLSSSSPSLPLSVPVLAIKSPSTITLSFSLCFSIHSLMRTGFFSIFPFTYIPSIVHSSSFALTHVTVAPYSSPPLPRPPPPITLTSLLFFFAYCFVHLYPSGILLLILSHPFSFTHVSISTITFNFSIPFQKTLSLCANPATFQNATLFYFILFIQRYLYLLYQSAILDPWFWIFELWSLIYNQ